MHELAASLHRLGHGVRIVSAATRPDNSPVLGVPVTRLRRRSLLGRRFGELGVEAGFGAQTLAHCVGGRVDVWHAMTTSDAAAAAACAGLRRRLRSVFTDHGYPAAPSRSHRTDASLHRYVVRHIDHYVCVSTAAGSYLQQDFGRAPTVVPPGVHLRDYQPRPRHPTPVLLYSGTLTEPRKNVPMLLEAAETLATQHPGLEVWLHGPGDVTALLERAGAAARLVTRAGSLSSSDLARAYATAWVTVLPSVAESFGMVVVESLASGTPVVVLADSGGPAGIVNDDRIGRRAAANAPALADACAEVLALAAEPMTADICRAHADPYDWDRHITPALLDVYERG